MGVGKGEGIKQKKKRKKPPRHNSRMITRGHEGWEEGEEGKGGVSGDGRGLGLGNTQHTSSITHALYTQVYR